MTENNGQNYALPLDAVNAACKALGIEIDDMFTAEVSHNGDTTRNAAGRVAVMLEMALVGAAPIIAAHALRKASAELRPLDVTDAYDAGQLYASRMLQNYAKALEEQ